MANQQVVNPSFNPRKTSRIAILVAALFLLVMVFRNCIVIIDSGEIGVPVLFGKVQEYNLSEGINFVNPFIKVVRYPIRIQEYTMSSIAGEGRQRGDDSINIKTSDGLNVKVDMTIWWYINKEQAFSIYREIAKRSMEIEPKILRPAVRTIVRDVAVKFTMDGLYTSGRQEFVRTVTEELKKIVESKHIVVDKVLVRSIILPEEVEMAISRKMKTMQQSEEMEFKKQIARKEAEIKAIEAKGTAKRQEIINQSLTPLYVQFRAIEIYKELVSSPNSTFVIMPTSEKGTGIPLILNPDKKK